jgi:hypothetical protein
MYQSMAHMDFLTVWPIGTKSAYIITEQLLSDCDRSFSSDAASRALKIS